MNGSRKMAKVRTRINENTWTIRTVTAEQMAEEREDGLEIAGLCISDRKLILIEENNIEERVVLHEMVHAYTSDLHLSDTNDMTLDDMEEIFASLFSEKGEMLIAKAKKVTKSLLKKGKK